VREDQQCRSRADSGTHEVHQHADDLDTVVLISVDCGLGPAPM
jgi:hypothetical protein